ncbi:retrograde protein of 51 kDa isoform X2 [Patella vulgata]|nr:retrograde protein of 51 kDa isoform X2 [Patella vulgata]
MSKGGQQQQRETMEFGSSGRGGSGYMQKRTTIINRGSHSRVPTGAGYNRSSMSGFSGLSLVPGTYSSMSHEGVVTMKEKRGHEKKEMQGLNERLGSYIEKVRFLEATITQLEQELDYYRNQKAADFKPVRDMYENELAQARRVIDDLSAEKAGVDAKMAGLQDLVDTLRQQVETLESHATDYRQKIDNQAAQIGGYEGELGTLRLRIENLENENAKLRQLNNQKMDDNRRLRTDLDNETAAHIEADCRATTLEEEVEFLRALLDKMPQESNKPVKIKGLDLEAFWKDNMAKAIRDIQNEYESRLDLMRQDMEARYSAQMRQLQSGAVRDNMETQHAKEESKKLKSQINNSGTKFAELEARIAALESERNALKKALANAEMELEEERSKHSADIQKLQNELECCLDEIKLILDAKLSLELEIACYRQLLEGEENRLGLRQIVEQAIGAQSKGAGNLADIVQQSS